MKDHKKHLVICESGRKPLDVKVIANQNRNW